jgi:probable HAF family extracellular repeat protein
MRRLFTIVFSVALLAIGSAQGAWAQKAKVYDLGHYPGGTWAELHNINDFGVAVGVGDVAGDKRMIGVPLFGHNAGNWFESGISSNAVDEVLPAISDTGMIVGAITGDNGKPEAYAWMPNHAGYHLGTLPGDFLSYAYAINHSATFIVGQSFGERQGTMVGTAVVWTPRVNWTDGRPTLTWDIHALPTGGLEQPGAVFEGVTLGFWGGWGVNDFGQIAGDGYTTNGTDWWEIAVVWNPIKHGSQWEMQRLPMFADLQYTEALSINNLGEIVGDVWGSTDKFQGAFPALWEKLPRHEKTWSLKVLPTTSGLTYGWSVAGHINDLGDIVGTSTDENWIGKATRWNTHDLSFVKLLGFPGDSSIAYGVNNLGIAVGGYAIGDAPEQAVAMKLH